MKIALISDIHGNLIALETVLAALERESPDQIVCLGDVAAGGPQPREVIRRLRQLNGVTIMGNTDEWLLNPSPFGQDSDFFHRIHEIEHWCAGQLTSDDLDYLRAFEPTAVIQVDSSVRLLCFHGGPQANKAIIRSTTPDEELEQLLAGFSADVMAGGHTHVPMIRRHKDILIVNPGSVGMPYLPLPEGQRRPSWAEYGLISYENGRFAIELCREPIDVTAVIQAIESSQMPHAAWSADEWR